MKAPYAGATTPAVAGRLTAFFSRHTELANRVPNGVAYELNKLHYDVANAVSKPNLLALMNLVPTTQMLFGSDYPYVNTALSANGLDSFGLPASDLAAINRGNAVTLFPRLKG